MDERVLKSISDRYLKDILLMNETEFDEGVRARYLNEARERNIDLSFMDAMTPETREQMKRKRIIIWGWTTSCTGSLFGFLCGVYILIAKNRNKTDSFRFDRKERTKGIIMIILTAVCIILWFCLSSGSH